GRIIEGDCIELIKKIPSKSIDLVITSPPYYKQRDWMGIGNEETPEAYLEKILGVFHECVRVTKDTGSIIFNLGDKYHEGSLLLIPYRFAIEALQREKVKLINTITWVKTNPTPRQFKRRLVQSTELFFHFVKSDNYKFNLHAFMSEEARTERKRRMKNIGQRYFKLIEEAPLSEYEKEMAREEQKKGHRRGERRQNKGVSHENSWHSRTRIRRSRGRSQNSNGKARLHNHKNSRE
ncbi:MAG: site-specific DNA-methyltransferase, partial [Methanophagales archaeon]|nr:site-specific DNA-methyltransferase [Methanophagales archaeon]